MAQGPRMDRRTFLKVSAAAGGGLLIGMHLPAFVPDGLAETLPQQKTFEPNAWIRIDPDDSVTIMVASSEMGQGVMTSIPMLIAEELDADWSKVRAEFAPVGEAYVNPILGRQLTGGSTAVRGFWEKLREAGAAGREMLVQAAAATWGVDQGSCRAQAGEVVHEATGRRLRYGQLAGKAATVPVPQTVFLKEPSEFRIIGTSKARLDTPAKVDGSARFGQDVKLPGMLIASVLRCPVFGGKVRSVDGNASKKVTGVRDILNLGDRVAVVADGFWAAKQGRGALKVDWDEGPNATLSNDEIFRRFREAVDKGVVARREGDASKALRGAARTLEAAYQVPYLAHACMEPMNCTAHVRSDGADIWVPTQAQGPTQQVAAKLTGLPTERIRVHTTFLGGGFGRRGETDFVQDAVAIAKAVKVPVKVIWTREDDTRHDFYRPAAYSRFSAGLAEDGTLVAWVHRIASPSISARAAPGRIEGGIDRSSVEGAANIPYGIPNVEVTYAMVNPGVPVGYWRSVGSSQNAYVTECFLDEVASALGKDPYALRRQLLGSSPRHLGVLQLAAEKAGWGEPLPAGRHRGIALASSFGSYVAEVAEVSVADKEVRVHRVVCAIDCGRVVNPNTIEAQMQSGIVYGLTAALKGEITVKNGRVQQGNFDDYPMLRMPEMPAVEVHIAKSDEHPGGVGEPGTPPIAPAVANAVFAATGKPVRRLPIKL
jgi:isoquinoline 1-oxidoreductase subunit beta